ncbi:MAG: S1/P1 nuclease [Paraprevotella sp.]|nr:S1/P1 nuclease [Paraprevotella sp.]
MRNLYRVSLVCLAMFVAVAETYAWGQKGHDVTCTIASRHLSKKARKQIHRLLDGRSMVYWSNWLDNASHTPQYSYTKTWHYKNVDDGMAYENAPTEPQGDVVAALRKLMHELSDAKVDDAQKTLALKMFIHLVGDLHQPMHMGHKTDLGGNLWTVCFFGKDTNLHSVWDTDVLESGHKWSHTEWAEELDRVDNMEMQQICQGTLDDWAQETQRLAVEIYGATPQYSNLSYDYLAQWTPCAETQLLRGGLRLAYLLNKIF